MFPSQDGLVRKLEIHVMKNGKSCTYQKPVCEMILLLEASDFKQNICTQHCRVWLVIVSANVNLCSWYLNHKMIICSIKPKNIHAQIKNIACHIKWFAIDDKIKNVIKYFPDWLRDIACIIHFIKKS